MARVHADKLREVTIGYDGTWVAHPGLVPIAMNVFNEKMPSPNQLDKQLMVSAFGCVTFISGVVAILQPLFLKPMI